MAAVPAIMAGASCGVTGSVGEPPPRIVVTPQSALLDTPVSTTISALPAGALTAVTASTRDHRGRVWSSAARFTADTQGRVSLSQPSMGGSYRGRDAMGLFETLAPAHPLARVRSFLSPPKAFDVAVRVRVNGQVVAATTVERQLPTTREVRKTNERLATTGIYGNLFLPAHTDPAHTSPASSVVHGSYPPTHPRSAAWTLAGTPLPFASRADYGEPDPPNAPNVIIPVERIRGPVFLVCGGSDRVWDSCSYLKGITDRLTSHHFRYPTTVLRYPAAGHLVGPLVPYLSFTSTQIAPGIATGGTVLADEQASADAWPKLLAFLTRAARLGG